MYRGKLHVLRGCFVCMYIGAWSCLEDGRLCPTLFLFNPPARPGLWPSITIFMHAFSHGLLAVVVLSCFTNCTKVVYTTSQYLSDLRTKKDVVDYMGLPAEQRTGEGITEWLYDYGSVGIGGSFSNGNVNASARSSGNTVYGNATGNSSTVTVFSNFQRYVKFTFDANGTTIRYAYQGVDFSKRKAAPGKTIALVLVCIAAAVGVVIAGIALGSSSSD